MNLDFKDITVEAIIFALIVVIIELIKSYKGFHKPRVNLDPIINALSTVSTKIARSLENQKAILDALQQIGKDAQNGAYAHKLRDKYQRPSDVRDFAFEEATIESLKKIIELLEKLRDFISERRLK